ncbi:MAG: helix-hairpin-helix domain-containing protein [Phycisphaeraceae bacterium]|nr:helix-hairpin-helix domain-containing protein [Phycisphaerales bacterium]MCB9860319.1 helix-hairpin-helix domain-containing protein [Phycisphaeraceae bacterium]
MSTHLHISSHSARERGIVLVLTLLVITIAALIGTTVLVASQAELGTTQRVTERTRSRALAWSGVQAAMAELSQQREELLDGFEPNLTPEAVVFELGDGFQGVFRLVEIGPEGELAVSENAKLDLNVTSEDVLAKIEAIGPSFASEIVKHRDSSPFVSTHDLLNVKGVSYDTFAGDAVGGSSFDAMMDVPVASFGSSDFGDLGGSLPLAQLVTVFSFDPNIQAGIGRRSSDTRGDLRLNLNQEWTEELGREAEKRFGPDGANAVKAIMESDRELKTMADVARLLIDLGNMGEGLSPDDWRGALDAVTTTSDWFLPGRVDINHAPKEVLAALPGLDADKAEQIASMRERLDEDTLQSPYWLIEHDIITVEEIPQLIDHITTRSMQWRIRVEAGIKRATEPGEEATDEFGMLLNDLDDLSQRVVYEAVIDVGSQQPRVAYLRDVTQLDLATSWANLVGYGTDGLEFDRESGFDQDLHDGMGDAGNGADSGTELETDNSRSADVNNDRSSSDTNGSDRSAANSSERRSDSGNNRSNMEADEPAEGSSSTGSRGADSGDNRIGRWTTHAPKVKDSGGSQ